MSKQYELIEAFTAEEMVKFEKHTAENIEPVSFLIGKPIDIVRFILKTDLREYKLVKRERGKA